MPSVVLVAMFPYPTIRTHAPSAKPGEAGFDHQTYQQRKQEEARDQQAIKGMLTAPNAEVMANLARECLGSGDLQRGMQAIALAVAVDSGQPDWRELLDQYMEHVERDEKSLLPFNAFPWFLFNPLCIYLAQRQGRLAEEELLLLTGVVDSFPGRLYLEHWFLDWLDRPTVRALGPKKLKSIFSTLLKRYPEHGQLTAEQQGFLKHAVQRMKLAEKVCGFDSELHVLKLMTLGKLGRFRPAVREGTRTYAARPCWDTAIAVANACRRSGDLSGATRYLRLAAKHNRTDETSLLELGDLYLNQERWKEALAAYARALARKPGHPWAVPSVLFCRYQLEGDSKARARLRQIARASGDRCGVADFFASLSGGYSPSDRQRRAQQLLAMLRARR